MIQVPVSDDYVALLIRLRKWLPEYGQASALFRDQCENEASPEAPVVKMLELGFTPGDQGAGIKASAAEANLIGLGQLLAAKGLVNFAPYSVARSVAETDAWALWMLDQNIDNRTMAGRWLTIQLQDQWHLRRMEPYMDSAAAQIATLTARADKLGLVPLVGLNRQPNGERLKEVIAFGDKRPGSTRLLADLLPDQGTASDLPQGELLYHVFSGMAHGELWALQVGALMAGANADSSVSLVLNLSFQVLFPAVGQALLLHDRMLVAWASFHGCDPSARPTSMAQDLAKS
jgi:hypothetical protein